MRPDGRWPRDELATFPTLDFGTTREAAADLSAAAKAAMDGPFYVFPSSKYEPDDSIWWLSPKDESAYKEPAEAAKSSADLERLPGVEGLPETTQDEDADTAD